jgi:hypothetical protein
VARLFAKRLRHGIGAEHTRSMAKAQPSNPSPLARFFDKQATWLKVVFAVTALATCVTAVAGAYAVISNLVGDDASTRGLTAEPGGEAIVVGNQTSETTAFVRMLFDAEKEARTVYLDHKLLGKAGPSDVTLNYECGGKGTWCATRVQVVEGYQQLPSGGVWVQGCYSVKHSNGNGFGAPTVDLPLTHVGPTCPSTP